jgi:hypothetical protein
MLGNGVAERDQHGVAAHPTPGGHLQGVAGVVVEEGQDLGVGAVGQRVVGEVGLPALVGQLRGEPDVGGLGALLRLGDDEPVFGQVACHGGPGHGQAVVVGQVPADGVRAGVEARDGQLLSQLDDQVDSLASHRGRGGLRSP